MSKINPTSPKPVGSATPVALPELGKLAKAEQQTRAEWETFKEDFKETQAAAKKNPSDAALASKLKRMTADAPAVHQKFKDAEAALERAVSTTVGGSKPADQAAKLFEKRKELADSFRFLTEVRNAQNPALGKAQDAALKAKDTPDFNKRLAELEPLQKKADALAVRRDKVAAELAAVDAALASRQGSALDAAKTAKAPGASDQFDIGDVASRTQDEQVRLTGAPVVSVNKHAAADLDAARVAQALKASPANAVKMLALQLKGTDEAGQSRLLKAAAPSIQQLVKAAQTDRATADQLLDLLPQVTGGLASPRSELARQLLAGAGDTLDGPIAKAAVQRVVLGNGKGTVEGTALADAARIHGKPELGKALGAVTAQKVAVAKAAFESAGKDIQKLNSDLARLVVGFGPMMTEAQKQRAISAFKNNHSKEYGAWETAGAHLAPMMQHVVESKDKELTALLPEFLATKAGGQAVTDALIQQEAGQSTFLDSFLKAGSITNDAAKAAQAVSVAVVKSVGLRAGQLMGAGKTAEAEKAIKMLNTNARLFGVEPGKLDGLTKQMGEALKTGGTVEAAAALKKEFRALETTAPGFTSGNALKGLTVLAGGLGAIENFKKFGTLRTDEQVKTIADAVGVGADAGVLAFEMAGKVAPFLKGVSGVGNLVSAVAEGVGAVEAFKKGEKAEGIASSASALGNAILAVNAIAVAMGTSIPVAGQIAGAVLLAGGTVAKWAIEGQKAQWAEDDLENDAADFLIAGGIPKAKAEALNDIKREDGRNVGMVIKDLAPVLGLTAQELFDHVKDLSPDKIKKFIEYTKDVSVDSKGRFVIGGNVKNTLKATATYMAKDDRSLLPAKAKIPENLW